MSVLEKCCKYLAKAVFVTTGTLIGMGSRHPEVIITGALVAEPGAQMFWDFVCGISHLYRGMSARDRQRFTAELSAKSDQEIEAAVSAGMEGEGNEFDEHTRSQVRGQHVLVMKKLRDYLIEREQDILEPNDWAGCWPDKVISIGTAAPIDHLLTLPNGHVACWSDRRLVYVNLLEERPEWTKLVGKDAVKLGFDEELQRLLWIEKWGWVQATDLNGRLSELFRVPCHSEYGVHGATFSNNGKWLLCNYFRKQGYGKLVSRWDIERREVWQPNDDFREISSALAVSDDGNTMILGKHNGGIRLMEQQSAQDFEAHQSSVSALALAGDKQQFVSASSVSYSYPNDNNPPGSSNPSISAWKTAGPTLIREKPMDHDVTQVAVSDDFHYLAAVTREGNLLLADKRMVEIPIMLSLSDKDVKFSAVAFIGFEQLAAGSTEGQLFIWDVAAW